MQGMGIQRRLCECHLKQTSPDSSPDGISVHKIPEWIERCQETKKLRTTEQEQSERENGKKNNNPKKANRNKEGGKGRN